MRFASILLLAGLAGCGEDRQCTYDTDCAIGRRCVATRCVPIQLAPIGDAGPGRDAAAGRDADVPSDASPGLDAGPDSSVDLECTLSMSPIGGVVLGDAQSAADAPVIVRAGANLYGVVVRSPVGLFAQYVDDQGAPLLEAFGPLNVGQAQPDIAVSTAVDGSLVVVWREPEDRLQGSFVSDLGAAPLGELTEATVGMSAPSIANGPDGFVVAWTDRGDGTDRISTRALDRSGVPEDPAVRFASVGAARLPAIANDLGEGFPVAWSDGRDGTNHPYAGIRYADGSIGGERELSGLALLGGVAAVSTPFGLFASWVEDTVGDDLDSVHVTRLEGDRLTDRVIAHQSGFDGRTSIAWDGDRALVGWQRGSGQGAEVTLAAVRPDLETASSLILEAGTARPALAADETQRGVLWIETATSTVLFGALSCE